MATSRLVPARRNPRQMTKLILYNRLSEPARPIMLLMPTFSSSSSCSSPLHPPPYSLFFLLRPPSSIPLLTINLEHPPQGSPERMERGSTSNRLPARRMRECNAQDREASFASMFNTNTFMRGFGDKGSRRLQDETWLISECCPYQETNSSGFWRMLSV